MGTKRFILGQGKLSGVPPNHMKYVTIMYRALRAPEVAL